tara:strand:- start:3079 stop:3393 length:315 start_codon:yes stop_codon:yes gene_type:complete
MKFWKWLVLIGSGIATALLVRRPKTYLDAMPELQKAVKKAEEDKKIELSKKTDKEIVADSSVSDSHSTTIERGKSDIAAASSRARANLSKRLSNHSKRRDSNTN